MCTVSWETEAAGLVLRFNRDEQRSRPVARPPLLHLRGGVRFLAPTDPLGGGTWLAANDFGLTICLLNHYAADPPAVGCGAPPPSRGLLVLDLADSSGCAEVFQRLHSRGKLPHRPFQLLAVEGDGLARAAVWDGEKLGGLEVSSHLLTTSSFRSEHVAGIRRKRWNELGPQPGRGDRFHAWREDSDPAVSVLMGREDARTVSRTTVAVSHDLISMAYSELDDTGGVASGAGLRLPRRRSSAPLPARPPEGQR